MKKSPIVILALVAAVSAAQAQTATGLSAPIDPGLAGNTDYDFFSDVSAVANPGRGSFPGAGAWSAPIESNTGGDAQLRKVANGAGGGPYAGSGSIYFGGFSGDVNNFGGTLGVSDSSPLADLKTIVFQVQIGEAWTYDFYNHAAPVLYINGGATAIEADFSEKLVKEWTGTVTMPSGEEDIYKNLYAFQWNLGDLGVEIESFDIQFSGVQHAQLYGLRLDQSDHAYSTEAVPEPASMAVLGMGALAMVRRRRNRK